MSRFKVYKDSSVFLREMQESYDAICMQFSHFPDEVDWPAIKALRNRIDHAYATIDATMVWKFALEDVHDIKEAVTRILKKRYGIS